MSLIDTLLADVARHESDLVKRLEDLAAEHRKTKRLLGEVSRHRKRLERDHRRGAYGLPLGDPDEPPPAEQAKLIPDEWNPDYETPEEPEEPPFVATEEPYQPEPEPLGHPLDRLPVIEDSSGKGKRRKAKAAEATDE